MADIQKMIEEVKGMTVLELNELVKALEEEFGVSAAAPVAVAAAGPAAVPLSPSGILGVPVSGRPHRAVQRRAAAPLSPLHTDAGRLLFAGDDAYVYAGTRNERSVYLRGRREPSSGR